MPARCDPTSPTSESKTQRIPSRLTLPTNPLTSRQFLISLPIILIRVRAFFLGLLLHVDESFAGGVSDCADEVSDGLWFCMCQRIAISWFFWSWLWNVIVKS
jgi:hypothetical protein